MCNYNRMNLACDLYEKFKELEIKTKELKSLKNEYDSMSDSMKAYMQKEKIDKLKVSDNVVLHLKERKTFSSLNREYILETLKSFYKNPEAQKKRPDDLAEKTTETLIENREEKLQQILRFLKK
jgi:ABC-type transporter Mla maintaining outer membrane lipid asymmetry ATPase subunit MlaF